MSNVQSASGWTHGALAGALTLLIHGLSDAAKQEC